MKVSVINESQLTGDFEKDIRSGAVKAFDNDYKLIEPALALAQVRAKANVTGVSTIDQHVAKRVFDSIKREQGVATVDATGAQSEPVKQSAYDSHKESLQNAWRDAGGAERQRYASAEEFEEQQKLAEEQRKTNEESSNNAQQKLKDQLANAWKMGN